MLFELADYISFKEDAKLRKDKWDEKYEKYRALFVMTQLFPFHICQAKQRSRGIPILHTMERTVPRMVFLTTV
eukprot:8237212-Ditylum_brightwellii.AAC.1